MQATITSFLVHQEAPWLPPCAYALASRHCVVHLSARVVNLIMMAPLLKGL